MNRNRLKSLIVCMFILIGCFAFVGDVNAVSIDTNTCAENYYDINSDYYTYAQEVTSTETIERHSQVFLFSYGNHVVYCTQKGVPLMYGNEPFAPSTKQISSSYVARSLAYGYYASTGSVACTANSTTDFRVATQIMVQFTASGRNNWQDLTRAQIQATLTGTRKDEVSLLAYDLKQTILNYKKIPSFAASSSDDVDKYTLNYDEENYRFSSSVTDTTGVFSFVDTKDYTWKVDSVPTKVTASKSGNTLKITSKDDAVTTPVTLSKTYIDDVAIYERIEGNNVQDVAYVTSTSTAPQKAYVGYKYEEIGKGKIGIHKIDRYTSNNMKDVTFGIYSDDKCTVKAKDYLGNELSSKKTDKNGLLEWSNLYYPLEKDTEKVYYVKELEMESGYTTDREDLKLLNAGENNCIPVPLKSKNETGLKNQESDNYEYIGTNNYKLIAIHNIPYGNITILKQDEDTGVAVEGVEFRLLKLDKDRTPATDINGVLVGNAVTNKWGVAVFENIPYGDYVLEEVKTPGSHKPLEKPIEFTLDKNTDALKYKKQGVEALPIIDTNDKFKYTLGDPTKDKKIDNSDLEILNKIVKGETKDITIDQRYASDVNQDGKVNNDDVSIMTKYISGETTLIEMKEIEVATDDLIPLETYRLGDPTDDGVIDNNDLTIIEKIIKSSETPEKSDEQIEESEKVEITKVEKYASDVSQDGKVDQHDKELMISYLGGNKAAFEGLKEIAYPDQFQVKATLVVTNVPIDIKISKQAITNSKEVKGATIIIKTKDGKIFHQYKSTGKPEEFYIPVGEYTLIEEIAPKGYENLKTEVKFSVGTDGNVKLLSAKSKMYKLVKSEEETDVDLDHLIIYNNLKKVIVPNTGSTIAFISIIGGTLLVASGAYVIYKRYNTVN